MTPTLPRLAAVGALIVIAVVAAACETTTAEANRLVGLINADRTARGLRPLGQDAGLGTGADVAARRQRDAWVDGGCRVPLPQAWQHTTATQRESTYRFSARDDLSWLSENVGATAVTAGPDEAIGRVHAAYLESPQHRAAVLHPRARVVGVGIVYGPTPAQAARCPATPVNSVQFSAEAFGA